MCLCGVEVPVNLVKKWVLVFGDVTAVAMSDAPSPPPTGCTPLILAASAGHSMTVSILLEHGAVVEAVSDRTKDTALSLACSGGRQEASPMTVP